MCCDALDVEITRVDRLAVVTVQGEIDVHTAFTLSTALNELDLDTFVWIDLERVGFMDSSGLDVLAFHAQRLRRSGGSIVVAKASPIVRRVVDIVGLKNLLQPVEVDLEFDSTAGAEHVKPRLVMFEHDSLGAGSRQITGTPKVPLAHVSTPRPAGLLRASAHVRERLQSISPHAWRSWPKAHGA